MIIDLTTLGLWDRLKVCWLILWWGEFGMSKAHGTISGVTDKGVPIDVRY